MSDQTNPTTDQHHVACTDQMSEQNTPAPGGWHGEPGMPLNPKEDGPHWLSWRDEKPRAVEWDSQSLAPVEDEDKQGFWRFGDLYGTPEQVAADGWRYLGPVASHEKVAALQKRVAELRQIIRCVAGCEHATASDEDLQEQVAAAICRMNNIDPTGHISIDGGPFDWAWKHFLPQARAALGMPADEA